MRTMIALVLELVDFKNGKETYSIRCCEIIGESLESLKEKVINSSKKDGDIRENYLMIVKKGNWEEYKILTEYEPENKFAQAIGITDILLLSNLKDYIEKFENKGKILFILEGYLHEFNKRAKENNIVIYGGKTKEKHILKGLGLNLLVVVLELDLKIKHNINTNRLSLLPPKGVKKSKARRTSV